MATNFSHNLSDKCINIKCCVCAQDNRVREADKYCVQCKDYYCSPCTEIHRKFPGTKEHQLLDKGEFMSLGADGSLPSFSTQRCPLHPAKLVDVFCADHDEVACSSCIILTHRTCTNIYTIPKKIDSVYICTEVTNSKQKIYKTKTPMEEIKKEKERKLKELKEKRDKEVESVRAFRQELITLLDYIEQQTIQEIEKEYDRLESNLTEEIRDINRLIDAMNEALRKSEGNKVQEYILVKSSEKLTAYAEDMEKGRQHRTDETVSFIADQNIKTILQQIQLLGKVSCNKSKVKNLTDINVKLADDSYESEYYGECCIWGSCLTADGSLLLTDYTNKKLKHLDMNTGTITDYITFEDNPWDVCLVNKKDAAVTLRDKAVQFVSLGNKMTVTRTLTVNHYCGGLAHKDDKLYISDHQKTVYIHDLNGQELRIVSTDAFEKEIFQCTRRITVSADGDKVFVADEYKGIVILDIQGNYLSTITDHILSFGCVGRLCLLDVAIPDMHISLFFSSIQALCTDGRNLFACGYSSNNIVEIGQDNKVLGELVKVERSLSLCFDPHKTRLIVTHFKNNKITLLNLQQ